MQLGQLPTFLFAALLALPASAQEAAPTPEQITADWLASSHADAMAEAFRHWDAEGEIPGECAVCHSTAGFAEFIGLGAPGTPMISHPVPTGGTIECGACHAADGPAIGPVALPSGVVVEGFGTSAVCTVCHQGRAAGADVEAAVASLDPDEVSPDLGFVNVHYSAAAATLMGGAGNGGFEYPGKTYAGRFEHIPPLATCVDCHGAHDTSIVVETCTTCHEGITDFRDIRTTEADIDGDGDVAEGIGHVVEALHARLLEGIGLYAAEVAGTPIAYDASAYPYFFADPDGDGMLAEGEAAFPNRYQSWTPRLLQAAHNYQFVAKDGGAHVHNAHYALQLMIDSLEDIGSAVDLDLSGLTRP